MVFTVLVMPIFSCPGLPTKYTHPKSLRRKLPPAVQQSHTRYDPCLARVAILFTESQYGFLQTVHFHKIGKGDLQKILPHSNLQSECLMKSGY